MTKFKNILIYGAGASGVLIKQLFDKNNLGNIIAFIDDNISLNNKILVGIYL